MSGYARYPDLPRFFTLGFYETTTKHQLADQCPAVVIHKLDVAWPDEIKAVVYALSTEAIDILINNAGVYFEHWGKDPLGHIHYEDWEATFRVNTLGAIRMTEAFVDHQARRGWLDASDVLNTRTPEDLKKLLRRDT